MKSSIIDAVDEESFLNAFNENPDHKFRALLKIYKGNYHYLILSAVFFILKRGYAWFLPIATSNIVDAITGEHGNTPWLIAINLIILVALVLENIPMNYLHTKYYSKAIRYVEAGLRSSLVRKLQQLSISYHKQMQSGRLQSKIMRDVEAVESLSHQLFINVLNITLSIGIALAVTLSKSLIVFGFFLVTVPVAVIIIRIFKDKVRKSNADLRKEIENTSAKVMEMVELVPVTRAHGLEEWEIDRMKGQLTTVAERGYKLDIVQSFFGSISWLAFQLFQLICLAFTSYLAFKGRITVGDVVLYQSYFTTIVNEVTSVINLLPIISKGMESVGSISSVLNDDDVEDNNNKKKVTDVQGKIEYKSVKFAYPDEPEREILSDLNLSVKAGETIALVGESGAGKSTILNLIIGFNHVTGGSILIDGENIENIDLRSLRKHLAVVPQNTILFSGTIRENITYGLPDISDETLNRVIDAANLRELIDSLPEGVETKINEHGSNLSGGQRQRMSIARALVRNPSIIILDEATSALDSISEKKIQDAINNLSKNRTTFIVAHRLSTIKGADRIAVIGEGGCMEIGTYDELMERKGAFYALKKLQA